MKGELGKKKLFFSHASCGIECGMMLLEQRHSTINQSIPHCSVLYRGTIAGNHCMRTKEELTFH